MKNFILLIILSFISSDKSFCQSNEWQLFANSRENYFGVTMANGQIGIVTNDTPLTTKEIILNGVYEASPENGISRIVRGIEFLNLRLKIDQKEVNNTKMMWEDREDLRKKLKEMDELEEEGNSPLNSV